MLYLRRNPTQYEDWQGILIFPTRGLEPDQARLHRSLLNSEQVRCIYLDELPSITELPLSLRLIRLTVEPEAVMVEQARDLIIQAKRGDSADLSPAAIIEVVATIAAYKFAHLSRAEVEAMLGINLQETQIYREAKSEEVLSLLEAKFGQLDDELRGIVEPLMVLPAIDRARMLLQMSREELIAQFRTSAP